MTLNKAIEHGKEKRKPYTGNKQWSHYCRNHGGCTFCEGNRKHSRVKRELAAEQYMEEYDRTDAEMNESITEEES